jgi:hypothetical protein
LFFLNDDLMIENDGECDAEIFFFSAALPAHIEIRIVEALRLVLARPLETVKIQN